MSLKRSLSVSSILQKTNSDELPRRMKKLSKSNLCEVCGDKASIINYGALCCQSCKTFFRRNGFHPEHVHQCLGNNSCEINIKTRRFCIACRLTKCLSVGMNSLLIRKEIQQTIKSSLKTKAQSSQTIKCEQVMSVSPLPTLDLLCSDRSSLKNYEWTLLSNVIHAHDRFSEIPQILCTIKDLSVSHINMSYKVAHALKTITVMYTSMHLFISSSPDFRILTVTEQTSLIDRNLHGVIGLYSTLFFRTSGIINNPNCVETFTTIYGSEMIFQAKRINNQLDVDSTIVKLMLIALAFSSNCFIVDTPSILYNDSLLYGTFRLFGSQNVYVELLWRYMIHRYGSYESVLRFSRLIGLFLDLIKYSGQIYTTNAIHHNQVDRIVERTEQSLLTNENNQQLLWGRT